MKDLAARSLVLISISVLIFVLPRLLPGDPLTLTASAEFSRSLDAAETARRAESWGLSGGLGAQYMRWIAGLVQGDLGRSISRGQPVAELLARALPWSCLLIAAALPLALFMGFFSGLLAQRRGVTAAVTLISVLPPFVLALLLLLAFALHLPLFPASGALPLFPASGLALWGQIAHHAALPVLVLALHQMARVHFIMAAEAQALDQRPFMLNARARGLSWGRITFAYYGRNLVPVLLARVSDMLPALFGTVLVVEIVFAYPGVGSLIYEAILARDYPMLQSVTLVLSAILVLAGYVVDLGMTRLLRRG